MLTQDEKQFYLGLFIGWLSTMLGVVITLLVF